MPCTSTTAPQTASEKLLTAILVASVSDAAQMVTSEHSKVNRDAFRALMREIGRTRGALLPPSDLRRALSHSSKLQEALKSGAKVEQLGVALRKCGGVPERAITQAAQALKRCVRPIRFQNDRYLRPRDE